LFFPSFALFRGFSPHSTSYSLLGLSPLIGWSLHLALLCFRLKRLFVFCSRSSTSRSRQVLCLFLFLFLAFKVSIWLIFLIVNFPRSLFLEGESGYTFPLEKFVRCVSGPPCFSASLRFPPPLYTGVSRFCFSRLYFFFSSFGVLFFPYRSFPRVPHFFPPITKRDPCLLDIKHTPLLSLDWSDAFFFSPGREDPPPFTTGPLSSFVLFYFSHFCFHRLRPPPYPCFVNTWESSFFPKISCPFFSLVELGFPALRGGVQIYRFSPLFSYHCFSAEYPFQVFLFCDPLMACLGSPPDFPDTGQTIFPFFPFSMSCPGLSFSLPLFPPRPRRRLSFRSVRLGLVPSLQVGGESFLSPSPFPLRFAFCCCGLSGFRLLFCCDFFVLSFWEIPSFFGPFFDFPAPSTPDSPCVFPLTSSPFPVLFSGLLLPGNISFLSKSRYLFFFSLTVIFFHCTFLLSSVESFFTERPRIPSPSVATVGALISLLSIWGLAVFFSPPFYPTFFSPRSGPGRVFTLRRSTFIFFGETFFPGSFLFP